MVNGFRYYRALESVSIASALSTALTIFPCQIRVHQRWQSKLQLPTARKKERWPATAGSSPHAVTCQHCDSLHTTLVGLEPATFRSLVRRATSSATEPTVVVIPITFRVSVLVAEGTDHDLTGCKAVTGVKEWYVDRSCLGCLDHLQPNTHQSSTL